MQEPVINNSNKNDKSISFHKIDTNLSKIKDSHKKIEEKIIITENFNFKDQNITKIDEKITPSLEHLQTYNEQTFKTDEKSEISAKLETDSKKEEIDLKYEKLSNFPQTIEDNYSKYSDYESEKENLTEKGLVEESFKIKLFIYPETKGITVFDAEELSENNLVCLCIKTKIFV